jgi:hypothetical protein
VWAYITLLTENINNADGIVWPAAFIALGFWIIMRKKKTGDHLGDGDLLG